MRNLFHVAAVASLLAGCAPFFGQNRDPAYTGQGAGTIALPPLVLYQNSAGPLTYRSPAASSAFTVEVRGEACQRALTLPVGLVWAAIKTGNAAYAPAYLSSGWGEGGYARAMSSAQKLAPNAHLTDVRADMRTRIILGIWREQCVRVVAAATAG
jgi:hypothetical protein